MPGFHHSVAVLPLVYNQSAFWSLHPYVYGKTFPLPAFPFSPATATVATERKNGNGTTARHNGTTERQRRNGNSRTASEWWKRGITRQHTACAMTVDRVALYWVLSANRCPCNDDRFSNGKSFCTGKTALLYRMLPTTALTSSAYFTWQRRAKISAIPVLPRFFCILLQRVSITCYVTRVI